MLENITNSIIEGIIFLATVAVGGWLVKWIFGPAIENSIKHIFNKKLEDYKYEQIKRQKAVLVAELLSEWISHPEDHKNLNKLSLEAFIWLPKETTVKLSELLSLNPKGEINVRTITAEVRTIIMGSEETIDPDSIILFTNKNKRQQ